MPGVRYAQFCPVARAAEVVGERWTLLIVRELMLGPRRFSDLLPPLTGVSPSVLSSRLASLEERGVVRKSRLPPPAASTVYELTPLGRGLEPMLMELGRWGIQLLGERREGDYFDPAWVQLALSIFRRTGPSPARRIQVRVPLEEGELAFGLEGGEDGVAVTREISDPEVSIEADAAVVMMMAMGELDPEDALGSGALRASGDVTVLRDFPALFETPTPQSTGD